MEQKIFNNSNKSRINYNLEFESHYWWLRSICDRRYDSSFVGFITSYGNINYFNNCLNCGIAPTCIIWIPISSSISSNNLVKNILDFWYNSLMKRKIFNSCNSRIRLDLEFNSNYWWIRSSHNSSVGGIYDGIVYCYYIDSFAFILPVCSIWWMSFRFLI